MRKILYLIILCCLTLSCSKTPKVPTEFSELTEQAIIYPDYRDVVVPPNIAPLNFQVKDTEADNFVVELKGEKGDPLLATGSKNGVVQFDMDKWHQLLAANKDATIQVSIYAERKDGWVRYKTHTMAVANEDIDTYLSYRLIEPGYDLYRQLGLYQRNLTNWDVQTIYENNPTFDEGKNHCINCHNYQNYSTEKMLFHVRTNPDSVAQSKEEYEQQVKTRGTIIIENGKPRKIGIQDSTIVTSGVYPSWHPKHNWIAFSSNKTGQVFHMKHDEKIEVIDEASDLIFYDADKNEIRHILRSTTELETFPCWSADGKTLYYCSAHVPDLLNVPDSLTGQYIMYYYQNIHYNLMSVSFDESTKTFGEPATVIDCTSENKSISVPRVSPDGKYILYTLGDYGQFHIWHKSSDLWVKNLKTGECYPLKEANSNDVDSYHTWSSNGRWIVFSSRRMDGNYTRPHIAYFDKQGKAHKAFCLPQEDPMHNLFLLKSYNVPELTKDAIRTTDEELRDFIYNESAQKAKYIKTSATTPRNIVEN